MPRILHVLWSLLVTAIISFLLPLIILGGLFLLLAGAQQITLLSSVSQASILQLSAFLKVLGSGSPWQGVLVVGLASSLVGVLFDSFTLYRYQSFGHH